LGEQIPVKSDHSGGGRENRRVLKCGAGARQEESGARMWTKRQLACEYRGVSTFPSPWFASEELHTEGATEGLLRAKGRPARRTLAIWGPYRGGCGPWTWPWPGAQPFAADSFAPPTPPGVSRRVEQPGQGTGVSLHDAAKDGEPGSGACRAQELVPLG